MATVRPQRLRYVPLDTVRRWDRNPKLHELEHLKESFRRHGFRGAIEFDGTLEAVVAGNGRDEALEQMRDAGEETPRWIPQDKKGRWLIPVLFGIDADSRDAAEQYGVDANSLTLAAGGFEPAHLEMLYDDDQLAALLSGWTENGNGDFSGLVLDVGGMFSDVQPLGEMPDLPTGGRSPFQQMTFTVSDEQAETVKAALAAAKAEPFGETGNDNSNGNALARLAEAYLG